LAWLATHQSPAGNFDVEAFDRQCARTAAADQPPGDGLGKGHDVGMTGLALLAFLGAGNTPREGKYADNVQRGVTWLPSQ
jgi:hypothetical protein